MSGQIIQRNPNHHSRYSSLLPPAAMAVIGVILGVPATHAAMPVAVVISSLQFCPSTRTTSCNVTSFELRMLGANFGRIPPIAGLINLGFVEFSNVQRSEE